MAARTIVECSNCEGGAGTWIAVASLLLALSSLAVTVRARRDSSRSADAAHESLEMARAEHKVWLDRVNARPDLDVTVKTLGAGPDGVLRTDGTAVFVRVEVGIANTGDRAAGPTVLNVLAPRGTAYFRWCGPMGEELPDARGIAQSSETFNLPSGQAVPSDYVVATLDGVALTAPQVKPVSFSVTFSEPLRNLEEVTVPLRAKAACDGLPDGKPEVVTEFLVCVRREVRAA